MDEIANTTNLPEYSPALRSLAEEAMAYSNSLAINMIQLGRVFTEAKALVPHGKWAEWVKLNSGMGERTAQNLMAIYERFGEKPAFASLGKTKLFRMLSLPAGTEEAFIENHNVAEMSSREIEEAVKRVRAQAAKELARERAAREAAEARAEELENREPEIPEETKRELERLEKEKQQAEDAAKTAEDARKKLQRDNDSMRRELEEQTEILSETQAEVDRAQAELLNLQSRTARERTANSNELSAEELSAAVRTFIGTVAKMALMRRAFSEMTDAEKGDYEDSLRTVETWIRDARRALEAATFQGVTVR